MSGDKLPEAMVLPEGVTLGSTMALPELNLPGAEDVQDLMEDLASKVKSLVDLPGDVYRLVTQIPDERRFREHFGTQGEGIVSVMVPVVRGLRDSVGGLPGGRYLQPVLLGKIFGVNDYVEDRTAILRAMGELPAKLAKETGGAPRFSRRYVAAIAAAVQALPSMDQWARLAVPSFWKGWFTDEWKNAFEKIDEHYRSIVVHEERLSRGLGMYRVAYVAAYQTLVEVDPVSRVLAELAPAVDVYRHYLKKRDLLSRFLKRLSDEHIEIPRAEAVEDPGSAPASPAADLATIPNLPATSESLAPLESLAPPTAPRVPAVLSEGGLPAAAGDDALLSQWSESTLHPPPAASLKTSAAPPTSALSPVLPKTLTLEPGRLPDVRPPASRPKLPKTGSLGRASGSLPRPTPPEKADLLPLQSPTETADTVPQAPADAVLVAPPPPWEE